MRTFNVHNIVFDTSSFDEAAEMATGFCVPDVPTEDEVWCDDEDEIEDILEHRYGFPVVSFTYDMSDEDFDDFGNAGEINSAKHDL